MKITERMRNVPIKAEPKVLKFKGNVRLELRDIKTGEVEVVADHNLQTNAIDQMLANCGFLNSTNLDKSNLVKQLIGGVCLFDTAITENPAITVPPAGLTMTANGAVDTINNDVPTELGSYSSTESGWRDANSYVEVYDWTSSQGNGVIACVCATNNEMGYSGFGNADGNATTRNFSLIGSATTYYVTGYAIRVSLSEGSTEGLRAEISGVKGETEELTTTDEKAVKTAQSEDTETKENADETEENADEMQDETVTE